MKATSVIGATLFSVLLILSGCDTETGADTTPVGITDFEVMYGSYSVEEDDELGPFAHSGGAEFQVSATANTSAAIHTWAFRNDMFHGEDEFVSIDPVVGQASQQTLVVGVSGDGTENEITIRVTVIDSAGNEVEQDVTFTVIFVAT